MHGISNDNSFALSIIIIIVIFELICIVFSIMKLILILNMSVAEDQTKSHYYIRNTDMTASMWINRASAGYHQLHRVRIY